MARGNILGNGNLFKGEQNPDKKEFRPPENEIVDSELISRLLEHYTEEIDNNRDLLSEDGFKSDVKTLQSMIMGTAAGLNPQLLIDSLTFRFREECDGEDFSRTKYLTAVVQALYNIGYNEFVIDVGEWPEGKYDIGDFLHGTPDKHLTLELYGNFRWCGDLAKNSNFTLYGKIGWCGWRAENSNFTLHGDVEWCGYKAENSNFSVYGDVKSCGYEAKNSNFTLHAEVESCGYGAENCTFDQMPNAKIEKYWALKSRGNLLRRLNDNGEWEIIR